MLTDILITLSIAVPSLVLLDQLLSEQQKTALNTGLLRVWDTLDELKSWSLFDWLSSRRMRWPLAITISVTLLALFALADLSGDRILYSGRLDGYIFHFLFFWVAIFVLLSRITLGLIFRSGTRWKMIGRAGVICAVGVLFFALFVYLIQTPHEADSTLPVLVYGLTVLLLPVFIGFLSSISALFLIGLVYVTSALLFSVELLVRRIAEYPKGPVLALSGFVGCVVAILKIIWG